jgi:hypothetical protein
VVPVAAAVIAAIKAPACRGIELRALGGRCDGVDVPIQPLVQALPRFTSILTAINAPLLDTDVHGPDDLQVRDH